MWERKNISRNISNKYSRDSFSQRMPKKDRKRAGGTKLAVYARPVSLFRSRQRHTARNVSANESYLCFIPLFGDRNLDCIEIITLHCRVVSKRRKHELKERRNERKSELRYTVKRGIRNRYTTIARNVTMRYACTITNMYLHLEMSTCVFDLCGERSASK